MKQQDPQLKPEQLDTVSLYNGKEIHRENHERKESSSRALVESALAPLVFDQGTSLRQRGVTECVQGVVGYC